MPTGPAPAEPAPTDVLAALGMPAPTRIARANSSDATVWQVRVDGRDLALRLHRPGVRAERERLAARVAARLGIPVPAPVATGHYGDRQVDVTRWCPGRTVGACFGDGGAAAEAVGRRFGALQARLHAAVFPAAGADADVDELRSEAQILAHAGCDPDLAGAIGQVLAARRARPRALLHMDYHPFNVLDDGHRVTGVVDWTNAAVGDPRFDLARTRSLFVLAEVLDPAYVAMVEPVLRAWRAGYEQVAPVPGDDELAPFLACAGCLLLADWRPRVAAGVAPAELLDVAGAWADRWRTRTLSGGTA